MDSVPGLELKNGEKEIRTSPNLMRRKAWKQCHIGKHSNSAKDLVVSKKGVKTWDAEIQTFCSECAESFPNCGRCWYSYFPNTEKYPKVDGGQYYNNCLTCFSKHYSIIITSADRICCSFHNEALSLLMRKIENIYPMG